MNINTNLSSLIVQSSLKSATKGLNTAIERMTTGFRINNARDNAANFSISTSMSTKISAYEVAEENASMGLDLVNTASGALDQMSDKLSRLRALQEQANNGTYGPDSIKAIRQEADAIVDEIERLYNTTEYNGIKLFVGTEKNQGTADLIVKVSPRDVSAMTALADVDEAASLTSGTYSISSADELAKLAKMTNAGLIGKNTEFVLANDIDLSAYSSGAGWTPIGNKTNAFQGTFDGNGYIISNLYINNPNGEGALFWGNVSAKIKNLGLENINVSAKNATGLINEANSIYNCYVTGDVESLEKNNAGWSPGLMAQSVNNVEYCYSKGSIYGYDIAAGLVGLVDTISNSYSTADASIDRWARQPSFGDASGLVSTVQGSIENCFATGDVYAEARGFGAGLVSHMNGQLMKNCYSTGTVTRANVYTGSLVGYASGTTFENCYALSNITGGTSGTAGAFCAGGSSLTAVNSFYLNSFDTSGIAAFGQGGTVTNCQSYNGGVPFTADVLKPPVEDDKDYAELYFQVGTSSSESSRVSCSIAFSMNGLNSLRKIEDKDNLARIDEMIRTVSAKQTEFGSTQNRLESALEEISVQYENLLSSRSTLRDADIAEESSAYIRNQILQQASATLLATANQTPSIALQLL